MAVSHSGTQTHGSNRATDRCIRWLMEHGMVADKRAPGSLSGRRQLTAIGASVT